MRELLRKDTTFVWKSVHDQALRKLKEAMCKDKCLSYFDSSKKTIVIADAGPQAVGAVLAQESVVNYDVVAYASKALTPMEMKFYQTEKEALALVFACEKFRNYLIGNKLQIYSIYLAYQRVGKCYQVSNSNCGPIVKH